jgi:hypothetical protein
MNLLSGLEKFGLDQKVEAEHLFDSDKEEKKGKNAVIEKKTVHSEEEFLLEKTVRCPVCDSTFRTRVLKSGRVKRLEPDKDLRPRFQYIDSNKYDICSCPKCGYTGMNRYFSHVTTAQIKLLREGVQQRFNPSAIKSEKEASLTYERAIERYKLALFSTIVKRGKDSEKAYECLKLAWLYRGWLEELDKEGEVDAQLKETYEKEQNVYYEQAYEGFIKALATEDFPMCGMEEQTVNLLLANMAFRLKKYEQASHFVSTILISKVASRSIKDRAHDLKEEMIREIRRKNP